MPGLEDTNVNTQTAPAKQDKRQFKSFASRAEPSPKRKSSLPHHTLLLAQLPDIANKTTQPETKPEKKILPRKLSLETTRGCGYWEDQGRLCKSAREYSTKLSSIAEEE